MLYETFEKYKNDKSITVSQKGNIIFFNYIDVWYPYSWIQNSDKESICSAKSENGFEPEECKRMEVQNYS